MADKVYSKKINLACLAISAVILILTIFVFTTIPSEYDFFGAQQALDLVVETENPEILGDMIESNPAIVFGIIMMAFVAVLQIIALINVIRLVIGWLGFLGKKDSRVIAKKLSKHSKIAFGTIASVFGIHAIIASETGEFATDMTAAFVLTGIAFGLMYLAVRYYRWFVVDKVSYKDYVFLLIRDAMLIAAPIILLSLINTAPLAGFAKIFGNITGSASDKAVAQGVSGMILSIAYFFILFGSFGVVKRVVAYLPFDNYRKTANKAVSGKLLGIVISSLILIGSAAFTVTFVQFEAFETDYFVEYLKENATICLKILLLTISTYVLATVDNDEIRDVKIAVAPEKKEVEAPAEDAPAEE